VNASDNNKAVIGLEGDLLVYREQGTELWRTRLAAVAVIGEYTTANGPYIDDYFLVFVTTPERHHFHGSFYAVGRDALLASLTKRLGSSIECRLCNSTQLTSRCMWPTSLVGSSLFRFTRGPVGGGWARVRRLVSPEFAFDFTMEVESYLHSLADGNVQPLAAPNGGPATSSGNSEVTDGPPSVS